MQPAMIYTLKPNVTREEAIRILEPRGLRRLLAPAQRNLLRQVAEAYVPYRLYQVRLAGMSGKAPAQTRLFALDAVQGTLDLFEFPRAGAWKAPRPARCSNTGWPPEPRRRPGGRAKIALALGGVPLVQWAAPCRHSSEALRKSI